MSRLLIACSVSLLACEGSISTGHGPGNVDPTWPGTGQGGGTGTVDPYDPTKPLDPTKPVVCGAPPAARVWRLSHSQYDRSVQAVLGTTQTPSTNFEMQAAGSGFQNGADTSYVSPNLTRQYFDAAEALAAEAMTAPARLLPCTPASPSDTACVKKLIATLGRRLFREPLSTARAALYYDLYAQAATPSLGVQSVVEAMLQSPYFLYRRELGTPGQSGASVSLTPNELAAALSFLIWDSTPDDALLDAADQGTLSGQIDRLLADPKAHDFVWRFTEQQFELDRIERTDKDAVTFPQYTAQLQTDLAEEARAFVNHVTWNGTGTLLELLTADYSLLNARLATLYGVSGVTGTAFTKVTLPSGQRSGLLTHAGMLAVHGDERSGSPVQRGLFVRSRLLCQEMPAPPINVVDTLEPPSAVKTTRQRYEAHLQNASCSACHKLMDPVGFGFENFDGIGRWRTTENGVAVDVSGEILGTRALNGTFKGPLELTQKLSSSTEVSDCVATRYWRFAMGRVETNADACSLAAMRIAFHDSGTKLTDLVRALVATPGFNQRVKL